MSTLKIAGGGWGSWYDEGSSLAKTIPSRRLPHIGCMHHGDELRHTSSEGEIHLDCYKLTEALVSSYGYVYNMSNEAAYVWRI